MDNTANLEAPEEIRIGVLGDGSDSTVRKHELEAAQVIHRQSELIRLPRIALR